MFRVKYFVSYEIPQGDDTLLKGFSIITPPMFTDIEDYIDGYCVAIAEVNNSDYEKVIITRLNKLN